MVKLRAPMMSLGASGSIGNSITFSKWKGRAYARELVVPSNPKSGLQTGFRKMFGFLSQQWASVSTVDQASWDDQADAIVASAFNAYMKANQLRWRNFSPPSQAQGVSGAGDQVAWNTVPDATAGVDSVTIDWDITTANDGWGLIIYRSLSTGFTPSLANCVAIVPAGTTGADTWLDSPLDPDTYYYDAQPFTDGGSLGALTGEVNATVV